MKRPEDRRKVEQDRTREESQRIHPSNDRPVAPVIPIRPNIEEKPDGEAS